jgi:hypothetical protein
MIWYNTYQYIPIHTNMIQHGAVSGVWGQQSIMSAGFEASYVWWILKTTAARGFGGICELREISNRNFLDFWAGRQVAGPLSTATRSLAAFSQSNIGLVYSRNRRVHMALCGPRTERRAEIWPGFGCRKCMYWYVLIRKSMFWYVFGMY